MLRRDLVGAVHCLGKRRFSSAICTGAARKNKKPSRFPSRKEPVIDSRNNSWISGEKNVNYANHLRLEDVGAYENDQMRDIVEIGVHTLETKLRGNRFRWLIMDEYFDRVKTTAIRSFEHDLSECLISNNHSAASLAALIVPTAQSLVPTITSLSSSSTARSFFESKGLTTTNDQIEYLFEKAFQHHLRSVATQRTDAQDLTVSISNPAEWYPKARRIKRKLILHVGPTNSGKTYNALQRLKESKNGLYAGPLRLLAREVYHRFKSEGYRCNLVTGEEVIQDLDEFGNKASLSCSTVEMVDLKTEFEVAVIDEIQMIGDSSRGWAWTNALMGVRAKEVHLCGEASIIGLIYKISQMTGDEVIVKQYERLGKLQVEETPLGSSLSDLKRGDCIVVFSKKRILQYKADIEKSTNLKVGVIYGALPAETRTEQAKKFNDGEYDVLVASDAIGMGLNLRIKRVIFDNHKKFDGSKLAHIEIPHVKQIGGRAGRYKVAPSSTQTDDKALSVADDENVGYISAFKNDTLKRIDECMKHDTIPVNKAILWPSDEIWSHYISEFPNDTPLSVIMAKFKREVAKSKLYEIAEINDRLEIVRVLENVRGMLLTDMLRITTAPVSTRLPDFKNVLYGFGSNVARNQTKNVFQFDFLEFSLLKQRAWDVQDLSHLENLHRYLMIWLWMNNRYPELFVIRETAVDAKNLIEERIEETLSFKDANREKDKRR